MSETITTVKPGYKTTEFWLSAIATAVGLLIASDCIPETSAVMKIVGLGAAVLSSMGYSAARASVKKAP